jgi:hypothetical protein
MVRVQAGTVKLQPRKAGGFMLTLPISIARGLSLNDNVKLKVFVDYEEREIVYKLTE